MGLHVEVICDVGAEGCHSHMNNNPMGVSVGLAKQEAREMRWLVSRAQDVCPNCRPAR
jgi:hypothetical protein